MINENFCRECEKERTKKLKCPKIYFLHKEAICDHGVFWIGTSLETGKIKANEAATKDIDNHHDWCVYEYNVENIDYTEITNSCLPHLKVYQGVRGK